jgi:WD40 repeat protein
MTKGGKMSNNIISNMKPNDNFIIERRKNIATYLNIFFPYDLSKLISEYDYQLEGKVYTMTGHLKPVTCVAELRDSLHRIVSGSRDKTIKIWNIQNGMCDATFVGHTTPITCIAIHHDGRIISGSIGQIKIWNLQTGLCDITFTEEWLSLIYGINILPDGRIICASMNQEISIWNLQTKKCDIHFYLPFCRFYNIASDERIIVGSEYNTINVYNIQTKKYDYEWKCIPSHCIAIAYTNNQMIFLETETEEEPLNEWNLRIIKYTTTSKCIQDNYSLLQKNVAVLPDDRIVTTNGNNAIKVWNVHTGQQNNPKGKCDIILEGHTDLINGIVVLSDGRIATCSDDKTIKIWS